MTYSLYLLFRFASRHCVRFFQFDDVLVFILKIDRNDQFTDVLKVQDAMTNFGTAFFEFECLAPGMAQPIVYETLTFALGPILFGVVLWVACKRFERLDTAKTTIVVVSNFMYIMLTKRAMLLFSCVRLGSGPEDYFLTSDLTTQCWTGTHLWLVGLLGVPMLILFAVGIPVGFAVLLYRNRFLINGPSSAAKLSFAKNYGFLLHGYRLDNTAPLFWEAVTLSRRSALQSVAAFFTFKRHAQVRTFEALQKFKE